jgi:hypothetical protein
VQSIDCPLSNNHLGSLVTLDPKTKPMYSERTCRSYYCLHNISENITLLQIMVFLLEKLVKKDLKMTLVDLTKVPFWTSQF